METLAYLVTAILAVIYGSSVIAFGFSWGSSKAAGVVTIIFASIGILTGLWIASQLIDGNGLMVGGIPILVSGFSIWNTLRRRDSK